MRNCSPGENELKKVRRRCPGLGGCALRISSTRRRCARKPRTREPCSCSISNRLGYVAASDISAGSEPFTPPTRGSASRSRHSRPIRRTTKLSSVSSLRSPAATRLGGMTRSSAMRALPAAEYKRVVASGTTLVGANIMMPSGISTSLPARTMNVFLFSSRVPVSSPRMPRCSATRCTAGLSVRNESDPASTTYSPPLSGSAIRSVNSLPPRRSSFSTSVKVTSDSASAARRSFAAAPRPATPPPTMITCLVIALSPPSALGSCAGGLGGPRDVSLRAAVPAATPVRRS